MNKNSILKNSIYTAAILILAFLASLGIKFLFETPSLIPAVFVLAVFLISLLTDGYIYGLISALASVLAFNFAFAFPIYEFNFAIEENAVSALIMIAVTLLTCTLTAKIKRQEELRNESEMEKLRANLLRAISHDLRTPLTAIYGSASTIADNYYNLKDDDKITMLNGIKEDSQWLIRMVENLLSVTRFDSGNVKLIKSSVVLEELIDSALSKFQKRYPKVNITIEIPDDFITVLCDPILIEQVLLNLFENSVRHAKNFTYINLKVFTIGNTAVFEVHDDGIGIDSKILKNIFTSFSQSDSYADGKTHSMGIGLSVCAAIIKAHGGSISAENAKDGGATFRFTLYSEEENEQQI